MSGWAAVRAFFAARRTGKMTGARGGAPESGEGGAVSPPDLTRTKAPEVPDAANRAAEPAVPAVIAPELPAGVPVAQLSPLVLAYIGDAVFEVYVRQRLIARRGMRVNDLHREAVRLVSAGAQARLLQRLQPLLTAEEADVVRRGRNTRSGQPPKNADPHDYRLATALECLIGYLYYTGKKRRLETLIGLAFEEEMRS